MTSVTEIEQLIKPHMLKNLTFMVDNKVLKTGKLILFSIKDFFCVFTLALPDRPEKFSIYEIPYPFTTSATVSSLEFDYTLNSFCLCNTSITTKTKSLKIERPSKFFNKTVVVIPN